MSPETKNIDNYLFCLEGHVVSVFDHVCYSHFPEIVLQEDNTIK